MLDLPGQVMPRKKKSAVVNYRLLESTMPRYTKQANRALAMEGSLRPTKSPKRGTKKQATVHPAKYIEPKSPTFT